MDSKKEPKELTIKGIYSWAMTSEGASCPDNERDPNVNHSHHTLTLLNGEEGEVCKIEFGVVHQAQAIRRGVSLFDLYDCEDQFHFDYFSRIQPHVEKEEVDNDLVDLLEADKVILLVEDDLAGLTPDERFDMLQTLENIFADVLIAVCCVGQSEISRQLATVFNKIPDLSPEGDDNEVWLFHDSKYRWIVSDPLANN